MGNMFVRVLGKDWDELAVGILGSHRGSGRGCEPYQQMPEEGLSDKLMIATQSVQEMAGPAIHDYGI